MKKREPLSNSGDNANWYSQYRKQYEDTFPLSNFFDSTKFYFSC